MTAKTARDKPRVHEPPLTPTLIIRYRLQTSLYLRDELRLEIFVLHGIDAYYRLSIGKERQQMSDVQEGYELQEV